MPEHTTDAMQLSYGVKTACRKLDVSRATLYRMVQSGALAKRKLRGKTVFTHEDLERLLGRTAAAA